ncbi:MAG: hypothetical protein IKU52_07655 [Clostridia bacterium]|nr:hypothetical protein [Clostridia bacterium]
MFRIDMHSHILPGCDHGSDSVETSVAQVKRAYAAGVRAIHLSSHYYNHKDDIESFLNRRNRCYNKLMDTLDSDIKDSVKFVLGAEVTLEVELANEADLAALAIGDTRNILIEMPDMRWTDWTYNALYEIGVRHNLKPLIAHVDRYDQKQCAKLYEMGLNIQVNASAFSSIFTRGKMLKLFHGGIAHVIGSDVHGKEAKEYDQYEKALHYLSVHEEEIMENAAKILGI